MLEIRINYIYSNIIDKNVTRVNKISHTVDDFYSTNSINKGGHIVKVNFQVKIRDRNIKYRRRPSGGLVEPHRTSSNRTSTNRTSTNRTSTNTTSTNTTSTNRNSSTNHASRYVRRIVCKRMSTIYLIFNLYFSKTIKFNLFLFDNNDYLKHQQFI